MNRLWRLRTSLFIIWISFSHSSMFGTSETIRLNIGDSVTIAVKNDEYLKASRKSIVDFFEKGPGQFRVTGLKPGFIAVKVVGPNQERRLFVEVLNKTSRRRGPKSCAVAGFTCVRGRLRGTVSSVEEVSFLTKHCAQGRSCILDINRPVVEVTIIESGINLQNGRVFGRTPVFDTQFKFKDIISRVRTSEHHIHHMKVSIGFKGVFEQSQIGSNPNADTPSSEMRTSGGIEILRVNKQGARVAFDFKLGAGGRFSSRKINRLMSEVSIPWQTFFLLGQLDGKSEDSASNAASMLRAVPIIGPLFSLDSSARHQQTVYFYIYIKRV